MVMMGQIARKRLLVESNPAPCSNKKKQKLMSDHTGILEILQEAASEVSTAISKKLFSTELITRLAKLTSSLGPIQFELTKENLELHQTLLSRGCTQLDLVTLTMLTVRHSIRQLERQIQPDPRQLHEYSALPSSIPNSSPMSCLNECPHCGVVGCADNGFTVTAIPYDPLHDPRLPRCPPLDEFMDRDTATNYSQDCETKSSSPQRNHDNNV
jgi:hypothetical protein